MVVPVSGRTRSRTATAAATVARPRSRSGENVVLLSDEERDRRDVVVDDDDEEEELHYVGEEKVEVVDADDDSDEPFHVAADLPRVDDEAMEDGEFTEDDRPPSTTSSSELPPASHRRADRGGYGRIADDDFSNLHLPNLKSSRGTSKSSLVERKPDRRSSKSNLSRRETGFDDRRSSHWGDRGGRGRKKKVVKVIDISEDDEDEDVSGVNAGADDGAALYYGRVRTASDDKKRKRSENFSPAVKKQRRARSPAHYWEPKEYGMKKEEMSSHEQEPHFASAKKSTNGGLPRDHQNFYLESSSSSFGEINETKFVDVPHYQSSSSSSFAGAAAAAPAADGVADDAEEAEAATSSDSTFNEGGGNNPIGGEEAQSKFMSGEKVNEGVGNAQWGEARRYSAPRRSDPLFDLLVNTIWDKGSKLQDENGAGTAAGGVHRQDYFMLPRKFIISDDEAPVVGKTEMEKAIDDMWGDFEFAKASLHLGTFDPMNDWREGRRNVDPSMRCAEGDHEYVLNDQVGIICNICGFIKEEIRHIFPSMTSKPWLLSGKTRYPGEENYPLFDNLYHGETIDGKPCGPSEVPPGTIWDMIKIRKNLFPHQREGLEFMWKNLAGSIFLEDLKKSTIPNGGEEGGCVISHAPGTGKTRLTIVFLQSFMEIFPTCKPIIIAPQTMLLVWEGEIKKWKVDIPIHNLSLKNLAENEDAAALKLFKKVGQNSVNLVRLVKLHSWYKRKSILLISYDLFQKLTTTTKERKSSPLRKKKERQEKEAAEIAKILLEKPTLLVLDEGHRPRNSRSEIWKSFIKVKAKSRIILSGTPFQNNLKELHSTLCLVRPDFSSNRKFQTVLSKKRERDGWAVLTQNVLQAPEEKLREVQSLFSSFVHVYDGGILQSLPGKKDCWLVLEPCPYQKSLLEKIQELPADSSLGRGCTISWISIHPSLALKSKLSGSESNVVDRPLLEKMRNDPTEGVKTKFLVELVRLSCVENEKVLIFSEHIEPLELVKEQLMCYFNWMEEKEILEINGQTKLQVREMRMETFNDASSEARVLLATTKTCCEGINLVGASRVVLVDVVWNPSVEKQAISRAFRMGQKKVVYVYHLITAGAQDKDKMYKQATKQLVSKLVFSSKGAHEGERGDVFFNETEDKILEAMIKHENLKDMFGKILYNQPNSFDMAVDVEAVNSPS